MLLGTGVIVYAIASQDSNLNLPINVTFSIDSTNLASWTKQQTMNSTIPDVTAYTIQNLSNNVNEEHNLTVQLNTYYGAETYFALDWILVTQENQPAPTSSNVNIGAMNVNVGAIIGGAVGGAVVLAVLAAILYCTWDRQPHAPFSGPHTSEVAPRPTRAPPLDPESLPRHAHDLTLPSESNQPPFRPLAPSNGALSGKAPPEATVLAWQGSSEGAASTPVVRTRDEQVQLTDEQVDFVRGLGSASVSPEDIARIIDRMRADYAEGRVTESRGMLPDYEALIRS